MAGKTLTSSLVVRLIDKVSGPARNVATSLLGLNKLANKGFGDNLRNAIDRNNAALDRARASLFDAAAAFYALKTAIASPVKAAMEFESAMADVKKVVDFPTPQGFLDFQEGLKEMSRRIPVSINGLAKIAAAAGQAGIALDDILKFTEAAAKIGVAFDISADQAGDAMAKLMTGLNLTVEEAVLLTDAMNHLSNAQASSASEILDVVRRVGAQGKQFGFTAEQTAAFASAMISAGAQSDVAATSFANMGRALTRGTSATKRQKDAFKKLGLDGKKVAKMMQKDAVGTTLKVLEAISKLPKEQQAALSSDLFGDEARALGPLLTNLGLLKTSLGLVDDQSKYAGSSLREYETRSKTFANAVEIFQNRIEGLKIAIGAALIPALNDLIAAISPAIDKITEFSAQHPELISRIFAAAAGLIAFKAATAALTFAGLLGKGGALSLLAIGFNTVGRAAIFARNAFAGSVGLQAALAAMSGARFGWLAKLAVGLWGIVMAVPGVSAIAAAITAVGAALATITAPVWVAIAAGVALVAAAGYALYKYWDRVSSVLSGVAKRIGEELQPAFNLLKPVLDVVKSGINAIGSAFDYVMQKISEFATWIGSFFSKEILSDEQKAGFEKAGYDVADAMINAIKAAFEGLLTWFTTLPQRIVAAIGNIDLSSIIKWPSLPSWMGGGGPEVAPANDNAKSATPSGHRAGGGPVWPGSSFLVGEKQPEIFTPKSAGTITPMSKIGSGGVTFGDIIIQGAGDPRETARLVRDAISGEINSLLRGAHADMGAR